MLIDRTHTRWMVISAIILIASTAIYVMTSAGSPYGAQGGSLAGLGFGIVGSLFMVFAGLLAARRPLRILRLGNARFWMRGHLWLGTLSVPLLLFHAGFGAGGLLEQLLWLCFGLVIVSGVFGLVIQQVLPRVMGTTVDHETVSDPGFVARRLTMMADIHAFDAWGPLGIESHEFMSLLERLQAEKNFKTIREAVELDSEEIDLLNKVWMGFKGSERLKLPHEQKCPEYLAQVYSLPATETPATETPASASRPAPKGDAEPGEAKKKSPLELMREQAAKKAAGDTEAGEVKKKSPLELAREQAAKKAAGDAEPGEVKKKSPLELAREQAAKKAAGDAEPGEVKKKSPLELAREQAAKKAAGDAESGEAKKKSPLELAREQAAKKAAGDAEPGEVKKNSPLELAREQAAKKAAGDAESGEAKKKSPLELAREQAAKKAAGDAGAGEVKKKSPLELAREQAAKKAAGDAGAGEAKKKSPLELMREQAAKKAGGGSRPAASPTVPSVARKTSPAAGKSKPAPAVEDATVQEHMRALYGQHIRPYLSQIGQSRGHSKLGTMAEKVLHRMQFQGATSKSSSAVDALRELCGERRKYDLQCQMKNWMQGWLMIHIPATVALAVFFIAHVIFVLRVIPPFSG